MRLIAVKVHAQSVVLRNDYPAYAGVEGLTCLVGSQPGSPWGLTWNTGIALTRIDYQHATRSCESYQRAPRRYRPLDPRRDPANPGGVLLAFGCLVAPERRGASGDPDAALIGSKRWRPPTS